MGNHPVRIRILEDTLQVQHWIYFSSILCIIDWELRSLHGDLTRSPAFSRAKKITSKRAPRRPPRLTRLAVLHPCRPRPAALPSFLPSAHPRAAGGRRGGGAFKKGNRAKPATLTMGLTTLEGCIHGVLDLGSGYVARGPNLLSSVCCA